MLARALTAYISPLVLVSDDLQWADLPSLEVIELPLSDDESLHPVMIIGCYRSNEVEMILTLWQKRSSHFKKTVEVPCIRLQILI